jgi:hypothetical protein
MKSNAVITDWVNEHTDYLLQIALFKTRDQKQAEDLVQDTFISAYQAIDSFQEKSQPRTWLIVLFAGALMGIMGIPLKISTALIFTLVLGISVDDTIHFLHRYLEFRAKYPCQLAVKLSIRAMLNPIFYTSIVLFIGFIVFSLSSFESIRVLGWITGLSLLVAMLADIILLPLLILRTEREKLVNAQH